MTNKNLKDIVSMVIIAIFLVSNLSLSFAMGPDMSPSPTTSLSDSIMYVETPSGSGAFKSPYILKYM